MTETALRTHKYVGLRGGPCEQIRVTGPLTHTNCWEGPDAAVHQVPPKSSPEAKIELLEDAYRSLQETARAYKRERDVDREHLDRLTALTSAFLASTTSEDGARLQQLHEALRAAQQHLAEPRHDEDWDVEP